MHMNGTLDTPELDHGYWRDDYMSKQIVEYYEASACARGIQDYCEPGYNGPCERSTV